ncbi:YfcC family protein [Clostridiaceae bacterium]|nr:YfcC family protein [Clostridiaceae bacterium]NBI83539.1 YfcC family protein [Clostridiaceae bacterium]
MTDSRTKKNFQLPHIFAILFCVLVIVTVLTHILPAGEYMRFEDPATGRNVIDPASYTQVESTPVGLLKMLSAIPNGFEQAAQIVILTFCVSGTFNLITSAGLIPALLKNVSRKFSDRGILVVPLLLVIISLLDCFLGMPELTIVYIPIVLPLMLGLGFDSITACAVVICGSACGFTAGLANPYTVILCQQLVNLPLYSGIPVRIAVYAVLLVVTCAYVMRYAAKVRKDPASSLTYEQDQKKRKNIAEDDGTPVVLSGRQKLAGVFAAAMFLFIITGTVAWGWGLAEMCGMFIAMGIGVGLVSGLNVNALCVNFLDGCRGIILGALVLGLARGISVIMTEGNILDTIVYGLSRMIGSLPSAVTIVGVLLAITVLNFFIYSGSGKAVLIMPIISPLADTLHITQQTVILAYQFGDGLSNTIYPTHASYMATLAVADVPWQKWMRFQLPLFLIWFIIACIFLLGAQTLGYGPF